MEYLQIDSIRHSTKANKTAEFTSMTVGKLIDELSSYDHDLPVIIRTSGDEFGLVGRVESKEDDWY